MNPHPQTVDLSRYADDHQITPSTPGARSFVARAILTGVLLGMGLLFYVLQHVMTPLDAAVTTVMLPVALFQGYLVLALLYYTTKILLGKDPNPHPHPRV